MNERSHAQESSAAASDEATRNTMAAPQTAEHLLANFTEGERQRLRYLRTCFERGKLTEFPQRVD